MVGTEHPGDQEWQCESGLVMTLKAWFCFEGVANKGDPYTYTGSLLDHCIPQD